MTQVHEERSDQEVLVELDDRRRVYLSKVGRVEHRRYLAHEEPGGVIVLVPAVVLTEAEVRLLQNPEVLQQIRDTFDNPSSLVRRGGRPKRKTT